MENDYICLVNIYKALGVPATGRVAIKMSTGEGSNPNYLKPELVKDLFFEVDGTLVECNTAYSSGPNDLKDDRNTSANHWEVIHRHGFTEYFPVDIMDEYDEIRIPVKDRSHIKYDIVGGHMAKVLEADVVCWATPIYYYEMSGQMKTLIDRMNALYPLDYKFRDVYMLSTAHEDEVDTPKRAEAGLTGWIDCFPESRLAGTLFCGGVNDPREIEGNAKLQAAFDIGKGI